MGKNIVFKMALVLMLICFCFTISYASDNDIEITTNSNIATSSNIATDSSIATSSNIATDSNISVDSSNSNEISISFSDGSSSSDRSSSSGGSYSSDSTSSDDIFNSLLDELKPYIGVEIEASTETSSSGADSLKAEESNKSNIPFVGGFVDDVTSFPLIMFIMFGIIYLTIVHYQNNVMIAESIRAMNRAGAYYQYIDMDIKGQAISDDKTPTAFDDSIPQDGIINIEMIRYRHVYRTLIDVLSEGVSKIFGFPFGTKKKQAHTYVNSRISNVTFKQYRDDKKDDVIGDVTGQGFMFFGDDLKVDVSRSYINPLKNISKALLGNNNVTDRVTNKKITISSVISNQAEFIRNIDTVYNIGSSVYELIKPK